jgi:diaminopimelate epimerase
MIQFYKYQGTGNDFVMIDNRLGSFPKEDLELISSICSRRFGIGSDGLILIEEHVSADFHMVYYNSDGSQSFCGNGARCAVRFASFLGMVSGKCSFEAIDGLHEATLDTENISIKMAAVSQLETNVFHDYILDTGSPHYVSFVDDLSVIDIVKVGKNIRYSPVYNDEGINVNVGCIENGRINLLTYERGVEDETYSCGTGATAAVLAYAEKNQLSSGEVEVLVKGGTLKVKFEKSNEGFGNIWLTGPAKESFRGTYG